jgi:hypothetical protein
MLLGRFENNNRRGLPDCHTPAKENISQAKQCVRARVVGATVSKYSLPGRHMIHNTVQAFSGGGVQFRTASQRVLAQAPGKQARLTRICSRSEPSIRATLGAY